jgi:hypothetical protein
VGAARGRRGPIDGSIRLGKIISDGYDGYQAEKDENFKTAKPTIRSLGHLMTSFRETIATKDTPEAKLRKAIRILNDADGAVIDRDTDKVAQVMDQAGAIINGDMSTGSLVLSILRNRLYDRSRQMYFELGVENASKAGPIGQYKTVLLDTYLALTAFGALDKSPRLRHALSLGTMFLTAYSAYSGIADMEQKHLTNNGYDTSDVPTHELFFSGVVRTATSHTPNIVVLPARLDNIG